MTYRSKIRLVFPTICLVSQKCCGEAREYPLGVLEYSSEEYSCILGGKQQYSLRILAGAGYGFEG